MHAKGEVDDGDVMVVLSTPAQPVEVKPTPYHCEFPLPVVWDPVPCENGDGVNTLDPSRLPSCQCSTPCEIRA